MNTSGQLMGPPADPSTSAPRKFSGFTGEIQHLRSCSFLFRDALVDQQEKGLAWFSSWAVMTSDQLTSVRLLWFCVGHIDPHAARRHGRSDLKELESESLNISVFIVSSANHKTVNINLILILKTVFEATAEDSLFKRNIFWLQSFRCTDQHVDLRSGCDRMAAQKHKFSEQKHSSCRLIPVLHIQITDTFRTDSVTAPSAVNLKNTDFVSSSMKIQPLIDTLSVPPGLQQQIGWGQVILRHQKLSHSAKNENTSIKKEKHH